MLTGDELPLLTSLNIQPEQNGLAATDKLMEYITKKSQAGIPVTQSEQESQENHFANQSFRKPEGSDSSSAGASVSQAVRHLAIKTQ